MERRDVRFDVKGTECAAWLYVPDRPAPCPAVIMAHGFAGTRILRLDAYAERFAASGFAVLVFDYRNFGDSGGQPRQVLDIRQQHEDWRTAIRFAKNLPEVDAARVALWGTSFSGGHVLQIAAEDPSIAACISQVPFVDGMATARNFGFESFLRLGWRSALDVIYGWLDRAPFCIPVVGMPKTPAAITTPDAEQVEQNLVPPGADWDNRVAARILISLLWYQPGKVAQKIKCPIFFGLAENDQVTPFHAAFSTANQTSRAEIHQYPLTHFDIYVGRPFEQAVSDQIEFLNNHLADNHEEDRR